MLPATPDRRQIGPAGPAGLLMAVVGFVLLVLALVISSRFALIMMVLSAGVLIGNAMVFGIAWLWQLGKI